MTFLNFAQARPLRADRLDRRPLTPEPFAAAHLDDMVARGLHPINSIPSSSQAAGESATIS